MFKWLKKVMISIINAIKSLFVGDKEAQKVTIGDTTVYTKEEPVEPVYNTIRLIRHVAVWYSSGNKLTASGSNYAEIRGTVDVYIENITEGGRTLDHTETVTLIPTATNASWMSINGTRLVASNRGDTTGDERTAYVDWIIPSGYALNEDYMTSAERVAVAQEANAIMSTGAGAITDFRLNGQNTIISIDDTAQTLYISSIAGYRNVSYTSGYTTTISIPNTGYVYTVSGGTGWVTINYNGSIAQSISIAANNTGSSREAVIVVKDGNYTSVQSSIRIQQGVSWELTLPSGSIDVSYSATSFSFDVVSTNNGAAYPITSTMISYGSNRSNISLSGITSVSGSVGTYRLTFSCSANNDTSNKTSTITITRPDHIESPRTISVIQEANVSVLEGIDNQHIADNNSHWVLGTVTNGRTEHFGVNGIPADNTGIIIACDSPIALDRTITISHITVQRRNPSAQGMPGVAYTANNVTQTISSGTTLEVSFDFTNSGGTSYTKTYYGAWLVIPNLQWTPQPSGSCWTETEGNNTTFLPAATTQVNSSGTITIS